MTFLGDAGGRVWFVLLVKAKGFRKEDFRAVGYESVPTTPELAKNGDAARFRVAVLIPRSLARWTPDGRQLWEEPNAHDLAAVGQALAERYIASQEDGGEGMGASVSGFCVSPGSNYSHESAAFVACDIDRQSLALFRGRTSDPVPRPSQRELFGH